ncbi:MULTISPECIES: hypothetical protein [unclassified Endozoicomonas]|uniref:hypothetical protein n=1 Tax=unclassified Endozoicomonas TaxID=2644528 RepID=UPI002147C7D6|nr:MULTISPECIES: hypothetical protein [unclassified Endozoicomonas]
MSAKIDPSESTHLDCSGSFGAVSWIEEISTRKAMKSGTRLFGNIILSLMNAGKALLSHTKKLLDFRADSARLEHPARDGYSGRTRLGFCAVGGA